MSNEERKGWQHLLVEYEQNDPSKSSSKLSSVSVVSLEFCHSLQLFNEEEAVLGQGVTSSSMAIFPSNAVLYEHTAGTPLATSYLISPIPKSMDQIIRESPCEKTAKHLITLHSIFLPSSKLENFPTGDAAPNQQRQFSNEIRNITQQYFALSWLTVSPFWPSRSSTLPVHFFVAQRLAKFVMLDEVAKNN